MAALTWNRRRRDACRRLDYRARAVHVQCGQDAADGKSLQHARRQLTGTLHADLRFVFGHDGVPAIQTLVHSPPSSPSAGYFLLRDELIDTPFAGVLQYCTPHVGHS